jgi:monovalent cation:proton antiporter
VSEPTDKRRGSPSPKPAAAWRRKFRSLASIRAYEDKAADDSRRIRLPGKFNDVYLHTASQVLVFLIMTYAIYILFAGHNNPGGGFVGGLVTATGFVLLYLAFDSKTVRQIIPVNFRSIGAAGVLIAVLTGAVPALMGEPFLTHRTDHARLPLVGDVHLATAVLFDIGVFLAVLGTAMTIISNISEDE